MLNQSAFVQGSILTPSTCGRLQERRNEHIPSPRLAIPGDICKTYGLFTSSSPPPLCSIKETGIQIPIIWFFGDISLPSSRSASFPNKSCSLPQHLNSRFTGLLCSEQSELGLGNRTRYQTLMMKTYSMDKGGQNPGGRRWEK